MSSQPLSARRESPSLGPLVRILKRAGRDWGAAVLIDEQQTVDSDLRDLEAELCRLPDVAAARIVGDAVGRPIEVHILAHTGKHPKQVVRDVQSVALASFGLELDRRIVSVVQLGPNSDEPAAAGDATSVVRPRILSVDSRVAGLRATVRIGLATGNAEATGFAEGSVAALARPRLVATATLDALRQLGAIDDRLDLEAAEVVRVAADNIAIVTLVSIEPPQEQRLCGSAITYQHADDAIVRAVLDATNRRLPFLAPARAHD